MAEGHCSEDEEEVMVKQAKPKVHDSGASDLELVRDFNDEEVDIGSIDTSSFLNNVKKIDQVKVKVSV